MSQLWGTDKRRWVILGSYACQCGIVPVPRAPLPARLGAAFGQEPPGADYSVLFAAVLNSGGNTGRDAQSTHGSLPHRSSSQPPSDDGSDSSSSSSSESSSQDSDDEHEPPDLPNLPPPPEADTAVGTVMERAYLAALAGAVARQVLASKEYREAGVAGKRHQKQLRRAAKVARRADRKAAAKVAKLNRKTLAVNSQCLAISVTGLQKHLSSLARDSAALQVRLAAELVINNDTATVRQKDLDKFPKGSAQWIEAVRRMGRHSDATGQRDSAIPQIGIGLTNGKLYTAIGHATQDPRFKDAFLTLLTSAQIYALVTGSFGAAPVGGNGNDQLKLVYGHSFCLYDADKPTVHRRQNNSTVYQPRTVPTVKQIIFLTDKQRNGQRFKDIYALEQACYYQGSLLGMIYGPVWKDVFDRCGRQMRRLYESDSQLFHVGLLQFLWDTAMCDWCQTIHAMTSEEEYPLSPSQIQLAALWGFDEPTPIPGDGFILQGPWMINNFETPRQEDEAAAVRHFVSQLTVADRVAGKFSGLPHDPDAGWVPTDVSSKVSPLATKPRGGRGKLGGDSSPDDSSEDNLGGAPSAGSDGEESAWESLGACDVIVFSPHAEKCAESGDWHEVGEASLAMLKPGKGSSQGKGGQGQGKGARGGRGPPAVRIAVPVLRKAYGELPNMRDAATGKSAGKACLRFLCNGPLDRKTGKSACLHACSSDKNHPDHTPGEICNRPHMALLEPPTLLVEAIAAIHGGLRPPLVLTRPPSDPIQLQRHTDGLVLRDANKETPPASYGSFALLPLGSVEELTRGAGVTGADTNVLTLQELGESPDVAGVQWFASGNTGNTSEVVRVGSLQLQRFPWTLKVLDTGSDLQDRPGGQNCLFKTIGYHTKELGYNASEYLKAAELEFSRVDAPNDRQGDYELYAKLLQSGGKLPLHICIHSGLPPGFALAVFHLGVGGSAKLLLITCGRPQVVGIAIIDHAHIMPAVRQDCSGDIAWSEFATALAEWQAQGGGFARFFISRTLPLVKGKRWYQLPEGVVVGGGYIDSKGVNDLSVVLGMEASSTRREEVAKPAGVSLESVQELGR